MSYGKKMTSKMNQLQLIIEANLPGRMVLQVGRVSVGLIQTKTTRQVYIAVQDEERKIMKLIVPEVPNTLSDEQFMPDPKHVTVRKGSE